MCMCTPCAYNNYKCQKKIPVSPGIGIIDRCEQPCEFQESNLGFLRDQQMLLTTELSLQPHLGIL